jgi:cysteine-rich repeat protein
MTSFQPRLAVPSFVALAFTLAASACAKETVPATICGDAILDPGEECDDGGNSAGDGCSPTCKNELGVRCGDSTLDAGEQCDDGGTTDGDGCSSTCALENAGLCGNGKLEPGEICDDGNTTAGDGCSPTCQSEAGARCGDGRLDSNEACDDGNTKAGDGCSPTCMLELPTSCDLVAQDCPQSLACDLDNTKLMQGGTKCRLVSVNGGDADTCASPGQCRAGFACVGSDANGTCLRFCGSDDDCAAPGGLCVQQLTYAPNMPIPGVFLCSENCSPLTAAGCAPGWSCSATHSPLAGDTRSMTRCTKAGSGGQGQSCAANSDCKVGFTCIGTSGGNKCLKSCVIGSGAGLGCSGLPGTKCTGLANPPLIGGLEYGVCF